VSFLAVQKRLDKNPGAMRMRRETMEMRMGATHFLTKTLPKVATEMALCVLTCNLTRVLHIVGVEAADGGNPRLVRAVTRAFPDV
jgi:hypothetical protein